MYQVHTSSFCLKYVPGTLLFSEVCTGMYHGHTPRKKYKIWYIIEAKSMYWVHTFSYILVCTGYIPEYDIFY